MAIWEVLGDAGNEQVWLLNHQQHKHAAPEPIKHLDSVGQPDMSLANQLA